MAPVTVTIIANWLCLAMALKTCICSWSEGYVTVTFSPIPIMAETPQNIAILRQISTKFNALSVKCPVFDGSGDIHIEDFLEDVVQYCHDTGRSSNQEMLQCLLYHLEGEAKSFTRIIKQKTWHSVTTQLRQHFGFSAVEQFVRNCTISSKTLQQHSRNMPLTEHISITLSQS